ncbi:MAG: TetR family transcriptional regulator [Petrimonas sp.]|nr:TetR family transcriptional regulator [Petrimonas sp.]
MEELSTEQKIIAAARSVFTKKGFAGARTRDIAEEAGINLALLNYYFGSKENLFKIVIKEKFEQLFGMISPILSDESVPLGTKIKTLVDNYTKLLKENEELPIFILNELSVNGHIFDELLQYARQISQPVLEKQLKNNGMTLSVPNFIMNIISLTIFPFIAKPLFVSAGLITIENYTDFLNERRDNIPDWIMKLSK